MRTELEGKEMELLDQKVNNDRVLAKTNEKLEKAIKDLAAEKSQVTDLKSKNKDLETKVILEKNRLSLRQKVQSSVTETQTGILLNKLGLKNSIVSSKSQIPISAIKAQSGRTNSLQTMTSFCKKRAAATLSKVTPQPDFPNK